MKDISPISATNSLSADNLTKQSVRGISRKFQDVLNQRAGGAGIDLYPQMVKLQSDMMTGKKFSPQELLAYQILVGQFSLRVEMLSKAAESASAAIKKFQTPQ